ncbi:MAG: hypothetical protein JNL88_04040, partial [Bacteroidia bacterium]|nr:hypothetical protein [Bacteroidia bacterium]
MNKTTTPSIAPEKVKNEKTRHLSLSGHLLQSGIRIWLLALILFTGLTNANAQSLVAGWDFQTTTTGGTATAASPATPKVYFSNFGSGFLFFDGSNGSSNWFVPASGSTSTELNAFGGTAINAGAGFSTVTSGASSLALVGGAAQAANGKRAVFS